MTLRPVPVAVTVLAVLGGLPSPIRANPATDLAVGRQVKVEGRTRPDGSFDAVQIVLRDVDHTVKIEGRVSAVRSDRKALTVMGFSVSLTSATTLYRGSRPGASRAELAPGAWLEVKGARQGDTVVAERIRIKEAAEPTEELEAVIERVGTPPGSVVVLGRQVWTPDTLSIVDERQGLDAGDTRLRRDDDEQSRQPWRLGSRVIVGGRIESAWVEEGNFDLDTAIDRTDQWVSRMQLLGSVQVTSSVETYGKVAVNRSAVVGSAGRLSRQDIEVQEAYVTAHRIGGSPVTIQVGRQRFRDTREWMHDEYLDAVRATATLGAWQLDGAFANGLLAGAVATRDRKDKRHVLGSATRAVAGRGRMTAFFVSRDDRGPADDDPRWLGGSFEAKLDGGSRLWVIGAARSGHRGLRQLGGWAMDAGATVALSDFTGSPSVTVGYARGSGDTVAGDNRDTTFRQTDLEDNSARFGGLRRLTYYGELFDPELSNLQVLTAGAGLRPTRSVGVDLVLHRYVQTVLRDSIPSSAFDLDATGVHGLLGHELDAAVTIRAGRFDIDLAAGAFLAGPGLSRERRLAFFWRPQVRLYF